MAAWNTRADLPPTLAAHHVTPQIAAQIICDMVLQMESPEGAEMRSAMINATMSTKVGGVTRWKRWAMVNEAIRALAAMDEAKP